MGGGGGVIGGLYVPQATRWVVVDCLCWRALMQKTRFYFLVPAPGEWYKPFWDEKKLVYCPAGFLTGATPWPPRISMATQHPKGARAEDRRSHRYHCYYCNHRAPTTKMCRHRRIGRASVVMQGMHDRPLQTRSHHAFLRASQLELGRPSTSTFVQSQHCHASSSRTCHHGL